MDSQIDVILSLLSKKERFYIIVPLITKEILSYRYSRDNELLITKLLNNEYYQFIQYLFETFDYVRPEFYIGFNFYLNSDFCKPEHFDRIILDSMTVNSDIVTKNWLQLSLCHLHLKNHYKLAKYLITSDKCDLHSNSNVLHILCRQSFCLQKIRHRQEKLIKMVLLKNVSICQLNNDQETPISLALKKAPYIIDYILKNHNNITIDDLQNNLNDTDKKLFTEIFIKENVNVNNDINTIIEDDIKLYDYVSYQHGNHLLSGTVVSESKFNYVTIILDLIHNVTTDWTINQLRISVEKSRLKKITLANNEMKPGSIITSINKVELGMLITKGIENYKSKWIISKIDEEKNEITITQSNDTSKILQKEQIVEVGLSRFRYALSE